MIIDDVINDLVAFAKRHHIIIKFLKMPSGMRSLAFIKQKFIIINTNCPESQLPFKIAHELGHVLLESDDRIFHSKSMDNRFSSEGTANDVALHLLIKFYLDECEEYNLNSVQPIMKQLHIAPKFLAKVQRITKECLTH
ncbi:ImmA/IrrE family metallo-endopeptidase [uncultured bacterium]|nr:ImmA/IrrE family metallo-endopeptidase [uncultured bacterium]